MGTAMDPNARQELLERIYAAPADDSLRQVFADWLLERGDDLGTFIALSLKLETGALEKRELSRRNGLLKKHRLDWLGPLAAVTNSQASAFRRGFLSSWVLRSEPPPHAWQAALHEPQLATVEEVQTWGTSPPQLLDVLRQPSLRHLKTLNLYSERVAPLCASPPAWRLRSLELGYAPDAAEVELLSSSAPFSGITRLGTDEGNRKDILASPLGQQLVELLMTAPPDAAGAAWLTENSDVPPTLQSLTLRAQCWYRLSRDETGAFRRLEVETGRLGLGIGEAAGFLPRLKPLALRTVSVRHVGERFLPDFMPTLRRGVDALGAQNVVRLPEVGEGQEPGVAR